MGTSTTDKNFFTKSLIYVVEFHCYCFRLLHRKQVPGLRMVENGIEVCYFITFYYTVIAILYGRYEDVTYLDAGTCYGTPHSITPHITLQP
jgi:hypothetical protein